MLVFLSGKIILLYLWKTGETIWKITIFIFLNKECHFIIFHCILFIFSVNLLNKIIIFLRKKCAAWNVIFVHVKYSTENISSFLDLLTSEFFLNIMEFHHAYLF